MNYILVRNLFIISLLSSHLFAGGGDTALRNTYDGVEINAESILKLQHPMPQELADKVALWFADNNTREIINELLSDCSFSHIGEKKEKAQQNLIAYLEAYNLQPYKLDSNFTFPFPPDLNYVVKISGHANRLINRAASENRTDLVWGNFDTEEKKAQRKQDFDALFERTKDLPTYQHVGRKAYNLLLSQKDYSPAAVNDEVYVVPIPGKQGICDQTCIILERVLPEGMTLDDALKIQEPPFNFEEDELEKNLKLMVDGALWWPKGNIRVVADSSQKCGRRTIHFDTEGPNNNPPQTFFHKDLWWYGNNLIAGLGEFADMLTEAKKTDAYELLRAWVVKNPIVRTASKYPELRTKLNLAELEEKYPLEVTEEKKS